MFCSSCGKEVQESDAYCPFCGSVITGNNKQVIDHDVSDQEYLIDSMLGNNSNKYSETEFHAQKESHKGNGLLNRLWNNEIFTNIAVRFDQLSDYVAIPFYIALACLCFWGGGFWLILIGTGMVGTALYCTLRIVARIKKSNAYFKNNPICPSCGKISSSKFFCSNCGSKMPQLKPVELEDEESKSENIVSAKLRLIIAPFVLFFVIWLLSSEVIDDVKGQWIIDNTKKITIDGCSNSLGDMAHNHLKNARWEKDKIDGDSYYVTVEGYYDDAGEDIKIKFRYEDLDDGYSVKVMKVFFPESDEEYSDRISLSILLDHLDE